MQSATGTPVRLSDFRGQKLVVWTWAPWNATRERLASMQRSSVSPAYANATTIAVGVNVEGPKSNAPWYEKAGCQFVTLSDTTLQFHLALGAPTAESLLLVDEAGKVAGFLPVVSAEDPVANRRMVESFLESPASKGDRNPPRAMSDTAYLSRLEADMATNPSDPDLLIARAATLVRLGKHDEAVALLADTKGLPAPQMAQVACIRAAALALAGKTADSAASLKTTFPLLPKNFGLRQQYLALMHPEKFVPTIDIGWVNSQVAALGSGSGDQVQR